jgi:beta-N-acetylhexosaminidase
VPDSGSVQRPPGETARRRAQAAARRAALRRRQAALAAVAVAALVAGAFVGTRGGGDSSSDDAQQAASAPSCPDAIASDTRRLVGQMLIVRMEATATEGLRERVADGEIGGVILFPPDGADPAALGEQVEALRRRAEGSGAPAPIVAIDQEGGDVKRLPGLPPERSPAQIATDGERAARAEGVATGRALRELGVDADLAPVLDVPAVDGGFIASRVFSDDPEEVAKLGVAFGTAIQEQGVAATAKHFPGLGLALENTDLGASTIDAGRSELEPGLVPFAAAIGAGFELVMVSNATYPALDRKRPASQSRQVIEGLLRGRLGYRGAVITDDLGAGALVGAGLDEGEAAVGAARAGADLLLLALTDGTAASDALVRAVRDGELERETVIASCARTTALRERLAG